MNSEPMNLGATATRESLTMVPDVAEHQTNNTASSISPEQWRGLIDLTEDGFQQAVSFVQRTHKAITNEPFRALSHIPVTAQPSEAVKMIHDGVTELTYTLVKTGGKLAALVARTIVDFRER